MKVWAKLSTYVLGWRIKGKVSSSISLVTITEYPPTKSNLLIRTIRNL